MIFFVKKRCTSTTSKKGKIMNFEVFKFENAKLQVVLEQSGKILVAMKPIADALELNWDTQRQHIMTDPVLNSVTVVTTATGADGKQYEMVCLPLDYLNDWLFKINANRYSGERREIIIRYQRECYRVLADHFLPNRQIAAPDSNIENIIKRTIENTPFGLHVERAMENVLLPTMLSILTKLLPAAVASTLTSYEKSIQCRKCQFAATTAAQVVADALLAQEQVKES